MAEPIIISDSDSDEPVMHEPSAEASVKPDAEMTDINFDECPAQLRMACLLMMNLIRTSDISFGNQTMQKVATQMGVPLKVIRWVEILAIPISLC